MRKDITEHIGNCLECQRYNAIKQKPAGLLQSMANFRRFEVIAIDIFGPLPTTMDGYKNILIVEDIASRWTEIFPMKEATTETCESTF